MKARFKQRLTLFNIFILVFFAMMISAVALFGNGVPDRYFLTMGMIGLSIPSISGAFMGVDLGINWARGKYFQPELWSKSDDKPES